MGAMRRTIAIALVAGLLFLGGCGRARAHRPADPAGPPATVSTTPAGPAAEPGTGTTGRAGDATVDNLLDQVGQQLSDDAQPGEDED